MSINVNRNNEVTVNTENMEESIMSNNVTSNNATVNTENMEETAMSENKTNNNNAEATNMRNSEAETLAELIPNDELAVSEADIIEENKIVTVGSIMPLEDMTSEISEDELAVENLPAELKDISKYGCFTPAVGMKGLITNTGHTFFAKVSYNPKEGRIIKYCQQYKDETFSNVMEIDAADLIMAATYNFMPKRIPENMLKNDIGKFITKTSKTYYRNTTHIREALGIIPILNLLINEYENLPVENNVPLLDLPEKLYAKIIQIIKNKHLDIVDEHNAYYTLDKDQIDTLAEELHVKSMRLLKKMKEYHFLYLTESSEGYQTCVRFKPHGEFFPKPYTEWCYCILKLDYLSQKRNKKE